MAYHDKIMHLLSGYVRVSAKLQHLGQSSLPGRIRKPASRIGLDRLSSALLNFIWLDCIPKQFTFEVLRCLWIESGLSVKVIHSWVRSRTDLTPAIVRFPTSISSFILFILPELPYDVDEEVYEERSLIFYLLFFSVLVFCCCYLAVRSCWMVAQMFCKQTQHEAGYDHRKS